MVAPVDRKHAQEAAREPLVALTGADTREIDGHPSKRERNQRNAEPRVFGKEYRNMLLGTCMNQGQESVLFMVLASANRPKDQNGLASEPPQILQMNSTRLCTKP